MDALFDCIVKKMIDFGEDVFRHPELGYREFRTSAKVKQLLDDEGIHWTEAAYTGLTAVIDGGFPGPEITLVCELDAVPTLGHPYAEKETSAAHTCGHYAQLGIMLAVFLYLHRSGVLASLSGRVRLVVTPAEEYCDLAYRNDLIKKGVVSFASGKRELIHEGIFKSADLILSCHTMGIDQDRWDAEVGSTLNGFMYKKATFIGKGAHAGSNPAGGINALNAADLAMTAINFQRETFREEDAIRVHYILSNGGLTINSIPEKTVLELYVRGKTLEVIKETNQKVDNCLKAGALAIGAKVEIADSMGYLPLFQDSALTAVVKQQIEKTCVAPRIAEGTHGFASGDMGDLSQIYPTVEIGISGFEGHIHGSDFKTKDTGRAYREPAAYFVATVIALLRDHAAKANEVKSSFNRRLNEKEYFELIANLSGVHMY
ncbi:MAG: amidohydrolase [Spirochaetia bacterium]|jgi:amidohydrolase|nr:amidohydrolase [Spirochaetia bacterium]